MTGASALRGARRIPAPHGATPAWYREFRLPAIAQARRAAMRDRDLDGDGLIESPCTAPA
jgi:hypothetical protein